MLLTAISAYLPYRPLFRRPKFNAGPINAGPNNAGSEKLENIEVQFFTNEAGFCPEMFL